MKHAVLTGTKIKLLKPAIESDLADKRKEWEFSHSFLIFCLFLWFIPGVAGNAVIYAACMFLVAHPARRCVAPMRRSMRVLLAPGCQALDGVCLRVAFLAAHLPGLDRFFLPDMAVNALGLRVLGAKRFFSVLRSIGTNGHTQYGY